MKLLAISDLHFEFRGLVEIIALANRVNESQAEVVVLAGDVISPYDSAWKLKMYEFVKIIKKPTIFIKGNHEYYGILSFKDWVSEFNDLIEELNKFPHFHYLDNETLTLDGYTFFGGTLWTNFNEDPLCEIDARNCVGDFRFSFWTVAQQKQAFYNCVESIKRVNADKLIVVTHFSPSMLSSHPKWGNNPLNRYFHNSLEGLIVEKEPLLWIHGHTHDFCDYNIENTRIFCNPLGYPSEGNIISLQPIEV